MSTRIALAVSLLIASAGASAQTPPAYLFVNQSSPVLIDDATARTTFNEIVSPKLARLYPPRNRGFATVVQGGFTQDKTCVVAASTLLLPRNRPTGTELMLFKPKKMATTYAALPNATAEQCADLARSKLREADTAILAALVPN
jgi:hypothetical protein